MAKLLFLQPGCVTCSMSRQAGRLPYLTIVIIIVPGHCLFVKAHLEPSQAKPSEPSFGPWRPLDVRPYSYPYFTPTLLVVGLGVW